jgi:DNA-binding MarR family transcriptional regulator
VSANTTAVVVAIVGVVGTLTSPVLSQRLYMRSRQQELDSQHQQRLEDRSYQKERSNFEDRRKSYVALNAAARSFRQALKNRIFEPTDTMDAELESARQKFGQRYSEAQLIAGQKVLDCAHSLSTRLAQTYGSVKKYTDSSIHEKSFQEEIHAELNGSVRDAIHALREVMRKDLGVEEQGGGWHG